MMMKAKVKDIRVKRVQNYTKNLPTSEKGKIIVDSTDLKNLETAFFGHNDSGNFAENVRAIFHEWGKEDFA